MRVCEGLRFVCVVVCGCSGGLRAFLCCLCDFDVLWSALSLMWSVVLGGGGYGRCFV